MCLYIKQGVLPNLVKNIPNLVTLGMDEIAISSDLGIEFMFINAVSVILQDIVTQKTHECCKLCDKTWGPCLISKLIHENKNTYIYFVIHNPNNLLKFQNSVMVNQDVNQYRFYIK